MTELARFDAFYGARLTNATEAVVADLYSAAMSRSHIHGLIDPCRTAFWRGFAGVLDDLTGTPESAWALAGFDAATIVANVAAEFGVDVEDLRGKVVMTNA
ncbi:MAG: hypothetical protein JWN03_7397 [Nocardia sp.]|uniref:hypothetical protein n=1 Tax=Nocardia sp. TaxID=1821 RepID=UPI00261B8A0C|nr:hypothetical protein [Nocardia sp.]MCU1647122.1 hypothetical protein [Nocardia sp.]